MTSEQLQKLRGLVLDGCNLSDQYRILIGLAVGELEQLKAENERLTQVVEQIKRLLSGEEIKVRHVDDGGFIVARLFEGKKGKREWHAILVAVDAHELADLIKQWEAEDA